MNVTVAILKQECCIMLFRGFIVLYCVYQNLQTRKRMHCCSQALDAAGFLKLANQKWAFSDANLKEPRPNIGYSRQSLGMHNRQYEMQKVVTHA